jgi:hypothetical protein
MMLGCNGGSFFYFGLFSNLSNCIVCIWVFFFYDFRFFFCFVIQFIIFIKMLSTKKKNIKKLYVTIRTYLY